MHPLDDISGEGAFGVEIVHGLVGLFAGGSQSAFHWVVVIWVESLDVLF